VTDDTAISNSEFIVALEKCSDKKHAAIFLRACKIGRFFPL
jgi:hypothetical protein